MYDNFPSYDQNKMVIAAWGKSTLAKAEEYGLEVKIQAPVEKAKSMSVAIENYIKENL